jgi:RHS repeat-associated protein
MGAPEFESLEGRLLLDSTPVAFADSDLEAAVRLTLGLPEAQPVTVDDMGTLESLAADSNVIDSLEGLQYATGLQELSLVPDDYSDPGHLLGADPLAPLAGLGDLESLTLQRVGIEEEDLASLGTPGDLRSLDLRYNALEGVHGLQASGLTNLEEVLLYGNPIEEISPLAGRAVNTDLPSLGAEQAKTIDELAAALHHMPNRIYEYVLNHIEYEPYLGMMKPDLAVLQTGRGNDFDTTSLLASLLESRTPEWHWELDESQGAAADDATNRGRDGQVTSGSVTWLPGSGQIDGACTLDGDDAIELASPDFAPDAFTVAFWARTGEHVHGSLGAGWGGFAFQIDGADVQVGTSLATRMAPVGQGGQLSGDLLDHETWQHFAFTFADGTGELYVDGELICSQGGMDAPEEWATFGASSTAGEGLGTASDDLGLDDLRVYRRALRGGEIRDLASDSPAAYILTRHVDGWVVASAEDVRNWMGTTDNDAAYASLYYMANYPNYQSDPVTGEDQIKFAHCWVEAKIIKQDGTHRWFQLAPAWKPKARQEGLPDLLDEVPFGDAEQNEYLEEIRPELPSEFYEGKVREYLAEADASLTIADVPFDGPILAQSVEKLTPMLDFPDQSYRPYPGTTVLMRFDTRNPAEGSEVDYFSHRVGLCLDSVTLDAQGEVTSRTNLFDQEFRVFEVCLSRLTISYEDAGVGQVRPVLRVDGERFFEQDLPAIGDSGVVELSIQDVIPMYTALSPRVYRREVGQHLAIGLDALQVSPALLREHREILTHATVARLSGEPYDEDNLIGGLLHMGLLEYNHEGDRAERSINALTGSVPITLNVGSGVSSAGALPEQPSDVEALPFRFAPEDLYVDIKSLAITGVSMGLNTVSIDGSTVTISGEGIPEAVSSSDTDQRIALLGYTSSAMEHRTWELLVNSPSMSSVKSIQVANEMALDGSDSVLQIQPGDPDDYILDLRNAQPLGWVDGEGRPIGDPLPEALIDTIDELVNSRGGTVIVPMRKTRLNDWYGVGYAAFTPNSLHFTIGGGLEGSTNFIGAGGYTSGQTLTPVVPDDYGSSLAQATVGDPINIATGAVEHDETDVALPSLAGGMELSRHYTSRDTGERARDHGFGEGWSFTNCDRLHFVTAADTVYPDLELGDIVWEKGDGDLLEFREEAGAYQTPDGVFGTLEPSGGGYLWEARNGEQMVFDASGKLLQARDRHGNGVQASYDAYGQLETIADQRDPSRTLLYAWTGDRITSVQDHTGREWSYGYDGNGLLASAMAPSPGGQAPRPLTEYSYCAGDVLGGLLETVTAPDGGVTTYRYYANRRGASVEDALGNVHDVYYDLFRSRTRFTDERGNETLHDYNDSGNPVLTIHPDGVATQQAWDDNQIQSVTDAFGRPRHYDYDAYGRLTSTTDALGQVTRYENYNSFGDVGRIVLPGGRTTRYEYDAAGNAVRAIDALGNTTGYDYDPWGRLTSETSPMGMLTADPADYTTSFSHNSAGQLTTLTDSLGAVASYSYDARGGLLTATDENGHATTYSYDELGRELTRTAPTDATRTMSYDAMGDPIARADEAGFETLYEYDAMRRLVRQVNPDGTCTTRDYDGAGNLVAATNELGEVTRYVYDDRNRLVMTVLPGGDILRSEYDGAGRVVREVDPLGVETTHRYDAVGRRVETVDPLGRIARNLYDLNGDLILSTTPASEAGYTYDAAGRRVGETYGFDLRSGLRFDFNSAEGSTAEGYIGVAPGTEYSSARGYGWEHEPWHPIEGGSREISDSLKQDYHWCDAEGVFRVDVPNGWYTVTIHLDAQRDQVDVWAEDAPSLPALWTDEDDFIATTLLVEVQDEQLELKIMDDGGTTSIWGLSGVDILSGIDARYDYSHYSHHELAAGWSDMPYLGGSSGWNPGYSWSGNEEEFFRESGLDDLTRDGIGSSTSDGLFTMPAPDGWYTVTVHLGDTSALAGVCVYAEDEIAVPAADTTTGALEYVARTFLVRVEDEQLDLRFTDTDGPFRWSLVAMEIMDGIRLDLGESDAVADGYVALPAADQYSPGIGYGWDKSDGGYVLGVVRAGTPDDTLTHDGHYSAIAGTFLADVPNGRYEVVAHLGNIGARDLVDVWSEGELKLNDFSTLAEQYLTREFPVLVEDGQLEVVLHDEGGTSTQWTLNALEIRPAVRETQRRSEYDADGNLIWESDEMGHCTHYAYDQAGRLIATTDSLNQTKRFAYDPAGNPLTVTDPLGRETHFAYDSLNRVVQESRSPLTSLAFDFGRADAPFEATGFVHVANADLFSGGAGYGWDAPVQGVDRRVGDDLHRDCAYANGYDGVFHVTVPDGLYLVTAHLGDSGVRDDIEVTAEGALVLQGITTGAYEYVARSFLAHVADGCLDLQFHDAGGANGVWSLSGLEITPHLRVDCDSTSLVTADGYAGFSSPRTYDAARGYGWETVTVGSFDRGSQAGDALTRDAHNSGVALGILRFDVAPGVYTVTACLGDTAARDNVSLSVLTGGQLVSKATGVSTAPGEHIRVTFETTVLPGEPLRIFIDDADDPGSGNYQWVLNGLEVMPGVYSTEHTEYDLRGNVATVTDALGNVTTRHYDALGRLTREVDALGAETRAVFDPTGAVRRATDALGGADHYVYDERGRQVLAVDAEGSQTQTTYDAAGNLLTMTDPSGNVSHYEYDEIGRLVSERDDMGRITKYRYNDRGYLESATRLPGYATHYEYDEFGRQTNVIERFDGIWLDCDADADSPTWDGCISLLPDTLYRPELGYGWDAQVTGCPDPLGEYALTTDCHQGTDDRTLLFDVPAGLYMLVVYMGGPIAQNDVQVIVNDEPMSYILTSAGQIETRILRIEASGEPVSVRFHDASTNGSIFWSVCGVGIMSGLRLDFGQTWESTAPGFGLMGPREYSASVGYGWENDLTYSNPGGEDLINCDGHRPDHGGGATFRVDLPDGWYTVRMHLGDSVQRDAMFVYANGEYLVQGLKTEAYEYVVATFVAETYYGSLRMAMGNDASGFDNSCSFNGIEILPGLPHQTTTEYDLAGNVVRITDALGNSTTQEYDALNRRTVVTDARDGVTRMRYDAAGNVVEIIDAEDESTTFAYDGMNRQVSQTDPLGNTTENVYDARGQIVAVVDALGNVTTTEYDDMGRAVYVVDALGHPTHFDYDALGQVTRVEAAAGAGLVLHWKLDEEDGAAALDASGNGNDASITGTADWRPDDGRHAGALLMDGSYQVGVTGLDFDPTAYTVAFWLKPTYLGASQRIGTGWGSFLLHTSGDGGAYVGTSGASRMTPASQGGQIPAGTFVVDDEWYHYAFIFDNGVASLCKDGDVVATMEDMDLPEPWETFDLFADVGAALGVRGWVDDVRVYERALLPSQIADAMACTDYATETTYDAVGRVLAETDPLGNTTWYEYDESGRIVAQTDAMGSEPGDPDHTTHFDYDAAGNLVSRTDALGNQNWYVYDAADRVVRAVDATGTGPDDLDHATTTAYDAFGNVASVTDPLGNTTWYLYDPVDREVARTNAMGSGPGDPLHTSDTEYDALGNITCVTDEMGHETHFTYDQLSRRVSSTDADEEVTTWSYDAAGNVLSVTDRLGNVTYYAYDELGRRIYVTDARGDYSGDPMVTAWTGYDELGNVAWTRTVLDELTEYEYDGLGRQTAVTDALGHTTTSTYDDAGNLICLTDPLGNSTRYAYDALGRQTSVIDALGNETEYEYDEVGNLIRVTDPLEHQTEYDHDEMGRVVSVTDALGNETEYEYDAAGNLTCVTDPLTHPTHYTYDAMGREVSATDALTETTLTQYGRTGNVTRVTDPAGNWTNFVYDDLGRLTQESTVYGTRVYTYDAEGNLETKTDRDGRVTEYDYDEIGNCVEERWLDGGVPINTVENTYDRLGRLTATQDGLSRSIRSYDALGRVRYVSNAGTPNVPSVSLTYTYDAAGNLYRVTDPLGGVMVHTYDAAGRRTRTTQTGDDVVEKRVDLYYDPAGRLAAVVRYNGLGDETLVSTSVYEYDLVDRLTDLTHFTTGETLVYGYVFDAAGRMTSMTSPDGLSEYSYDDTDQLTGADQTQHDYLSDEAYLYDENGNRMGWYITAAGNRMTSDGTSTYAYDAEGNRVLRTDASGGVREYEWDHRNRLVSVVDRASAGGAATQAVEFTYDTFDRRIAKRVDDDGDGPHDWKGSYFIYDGEHILLEHRDTYLGLRLAYRYLHGPGTDQLYAAEDAVAEEILWPFSDHQGSVRDLIDSYGSHPDHIVFDSFGQVDAVVGYGLPFTFGYAGREIDREIDLQYYRARYYDPAVGRFLSEDPIGFDAEDVNLYRYVRNNPLTNTDPSGLCSSSNNRDFSFLLNTGSTPITGPPSLRSTMSHVDAYTDPMAGFTDPMYSNLAAEYLRSSDTAQHHPLVGEFHDTPYVMDVYEPEDQLISPYRIFQPASSGAKAHNWAVYQMRNGTQDIPQGYREDIGYRYVETDNSAEPGKGRHAKIVTFEMQEMGHGKIVAEAKACTFHLLSAIGIAQIMEAAVGVEYAGYDSRLLSTGERWWRGAVGTAIAASWFVPLTRAAIKGSAAGRAAKLSAGTNATRARVMANISKSQTARASSNIDVLFAKEAHLGTMNALPKGAAYGASGATQTLRTPSLGAPVKEATQGVSSRLTTRLSKWRAYKAGGGKMDMRTWVRHTNHHSWGSGAKSEFAQWSKGVRGIEMHHVTPMYLGGAANGPRVPLPKDYHQLITNEFRKVHPYGQPAPDPTGLQKIMNRTYSKHPLP